ncbi:Protein of unknown function [Bacillus cytotoxicus]|uniref:Uncharacterized protein n=1 Tax=Bacillus cytotoxicus TaxID=580165 RepID=A0AAX2CE47_9BACI|nr:Protein of unknown function [Bacillus cytotoxicus]
MFQLSLFVE